MYHCDYGGSARQREEDCRRPDGVKTHYYSPCMENSNWTRPHREKEKTQTEGSREATETRTEEKSIEREDSIYKDMMLSVFVKLTWESAPISCKMSYSFCWTPLTLSTDVQTNEECRARNKSTRESLWMAVMEKRSNHLCRFLPQHAVQLSASKEYHCVR